MNIKLKLILLIGITCIINGCSSETQKPLKIASNSWIGYESLYVIEELDLMENKIQVTRKNNATEVMALFENGEVDAAGLTLDEAMTVLSRSKRDFVFASIMDISSGADQLLANKGISKISDLKGKRIAVEMTALGRLILNSALTDANLTTDDIYVLNETVDKHSELLSKGEIDAAISFPPFTEELKMLGMKKLYDSSQMQRAPIIDLLIVGKDVLDEKRGALTELVQKIYRINELLIKQEPQVFKIVGKNLGIPPEKQLSMTEGVELVTPNMNSIYINRYKLEATMIILEEVMLKNKLLDKAVSDKISPDMFVRF